MRTSPLHLVGVSAVILPLWAGCAGKSTDVCIIGTEDCICFPNKTCDEPLECSPSTNVCVPPAGGGAGGDGGTEGATGGEPSGGGGGTPGAAGGPGEPNTGGAPSTGGTEGTGGNAGVAAGGIVGVGGESTGGSESDTGGTAGSGGQPPHAGSSGIAGGGTASIGGAAGLAEQGGAGGVAGATAALGGSGGTPEGGAGSSGAAGAAGTHEPDTRAPCINIGFIGQDLSTASGATEDQLVNWLSSLDTVNIVRIGATDPLSDELLAPLHAIIVGNMQARIDAEALGEATSYTADEIDAMTTWVEGGGGLLTLAGYTGDENAAKPATDLLSSMQLAYDFVGRGAGIIGEGAPPNEVSVLPSVSHPAVSGVSKLGAYLGYPVTTENAADRTLIQSGDSKLAVAHVQGEGRVLVYFDDWITLVSEWANHTELQQETFWRSALNWLLAPVDCRLPT